MSRFKLSQSKAKFDQNKGVAQGYRTRFTEGVLKVRGIPKGDSKKKSLFWAGGSCHEIFIKEFRHQSVRFFFEKMGRPF